MNEKKLIKCPVCDNKFIPRTFYPEEAIFSTHDGKKLSGFNGYMSTRGVKPPEVILSSWITYCPKCNYVMKFVKELVRREKILTQKVNAKEVKEKYNSFYYGFPYGDYSQYLREITDIVQSQINDKLHDLNFETWENLYKVNDNFKFLVRFFTNLENYCDENLELATIKNMSVKIKKLNLPKDVEISLLQLNNIKDEIVKGDYELSPEDEENINNILVNFVFYLMQKHVKPMINSKLIEEDYNFIRFADLESEIKSYLGNYLNSTFNNTPYSSKQIRIFMNDFFEEIEV
jgi:hypothetical protein